MPGSSVFIQVAPILSSVLVNHNHVRVFLCRLRMHLIFTLLLLVKPSICSSTTAEGRQSDGVVETAPNTVGTAPNTKDARPLQQKISSDTFSIVPGFGAVFRNIRKRALNGPRAIVLRLISKAKRVPSHSHTRMDFEIKGDLEKALGDFNSFNPVIVKSHEGLRIGWAEDRYLKLRTKGSLGDPTLEVINWKRKGRGQYIQRFIYKKSH